MKSSTIAWIIVVLIIIAGGVWYMSSSNTPASSQGASAPDAMPSDMTTPTQAADNTTAPSPTAGSQTTPMSATVTYDGSSFSPSSVTIAKGGTVTFVNKSGGQMWVASGNHPDHTIYSGTTRTQHCPDTTGTAFDQCSTGNTYSFTFQKTGSWPYHNHVNAGVYGEIIVQ